MKILVRLGLQFYCKGIIGSLHLPNDSPIILACNHPNSFLDAVIIASRCKRQIHFLARADIFSNTFISRLLRGMNLIPIYRLTEGRSQLKNNQDTFNECLDILRKNGTLLIFSEGICKNEWTLRPLKKGTARLVNMAWQNQYLKNVIICPIAISYSSFTTLPVIVCLKPGKTIRREDTEARHPKPLHPHLTALLSEQIQNNLVSEKEMQQLYQGSKSWKRNLLAAPALIGWLTHKAFYNLIKGYAKRKTAGTVFFHSVLFGLLLLIYPVALILLATAVVLLTGKLIFCTLVLAFPFTAWCYKEYRASATSLYSRPTI